MARSRRTKPFESQDTAPLLQDDLLADTFATDQDGFDMIEVPPAPPSGSSLRRTVTGLKTEGRKAMTRSDTLHSSRRSEALSGAKDMGKAGVLLGADAALPGLGTGLGAVDSAMSIHSASKAGKGIGKETAVQAATTGASYIPVVGQFINFVGGAYQVAHATFEGAKPRTKRKAEAADKLAQRCHEGLERAAAAREGLATYVGEDREHMLSQIAKAEGRFHHGIAEAERWMVKKVERGTMPLLHGDDDGASDDPFVDPD